MSRRRKSADSVPFDTLRLEGSLFVPELLERAAHGDAAFQKEADYAIPKGLKLHDEYGRAFRIATASWQALAPHLERTDVDAAALTTSFAIDLLSQCFGYTDLARLNAPVQIEDRGFPVTARAVGGRLPVIVAPHSLGLDDPDPRFAIHGSGARKKSAHQLAQEFLNSSPDALWAIVTNGKTLRLLRDADTLTRPNFLEVDLETILRDEEQRYADFSALWRILHASRAGRPEQPPADCIWEQWKAEGHAQGLRVRDGLRDGVQEALLTLGTGFLKHPSNEPLRQKLQEGGLTKELYFQQLLRLVYRWLFLFCAEERELLHTPYATPDVLRVYADGYSMRRLRRRSLRPTARDSHGDLWLSVRIVFSGLGRGETRLGLPALGGLFAVSQCPDLDAASLANRDLLGAMKNLRWFTDKKSGHRGAIDYRNMGPEELGSVYESLLELVPTVDWHVREFGFVGITDQGSTDGNTRKTTGSYYTPDSLVQELIKTALDPVIAQKISAHPENPVEALLSLSVIDPACGSGHFLIAAARRLAEKLAELRAPDGAVRPNDYRHALREVISRCIHGVDRNPMALELARTALWLEGFEPGQPLSFLDHHLQCGDALLGITNFEQLRKGIAKDAFSPLSGDFKTVCKELSAINRDGLKSLANRFKNPGAELFDVTDLSGVLQQLQQVEELPEDSTAEVEAKASAYAQFLVEAEDSPLAHAADLLIAAFLTPKTPEETTFCPTTGTLLELLFPQQGQPYPEEIVALSTARCREALVFHWPLRFARIFARGGFDCVLGNPPWERIKLQEEEFFASREPLIVAAKNKAERAKRIQWLSEGSLHYHLSSYQSPSAPDKGELALYQEFAREKRLAEATSAFAHVNGVDGGRFPLTGVGDVNTYALFAETIEQVRSSEGRAGFIVPTGIATDDSTKAYFSHIGEGGKLVRLIDFENREGVFPGVHRSFKFSLLTLGKAEEAVFSFFLTQTDQLADARRSFALGPEDFRLINPNTRTCPVFRSEADAELTKKIYRRVPVLIEEARGEKKEQNPWGITFSTMFHMSNDSHLFLDRPEPDSLPLYEAKMIHQFDHRWATYVRDANKSEPVIADVDVGKKSDPDFEITPRYWVPKREVISRIARVPGSLLKAWYNDDGGAMLVALAHWVYASVEAEHGRPVWDDGLVSVNPDEVVAHSGIRHFDDLPDPWFDRSQLPEFQTFPPLDGFHYGFFSETRSFRESIAALIRDHSPRWLMGFRDICRSTDERTMIASITPRAAVGNNLPLMLFHWRTQPRQAAALLGNLCCVVLDFVARQKVGGVHMNFFILKQLPVVCPTTYTDEDLEFLVPRVLELTYTSKALSGWAEALQYEDEPSIFESDRRALLRADLDAYYARLYGLTREELQYILDPATTHGPDYPTVTFPGLKANEIKRYGEYRTQRLVLEAWDRLS